MTTPTTRPTDPISPPAPSTVGRRVPLTARIEPFDSYWQAPKDIDKGYDSFRQYYRCNCLKHLPGDKTQDTVVISCGPGYFVSLLNSMGYQDVLGIDSDAEKIKHAQAKDLIAALRRRFRF